MICTAHKTDGTPCTRLAMKGNTVCYTHGGASLKGIASPRFKNGGRSKYIPARLMERYNEAISDPELRRIDTDLALVESRLADLLLRVDTGDAGENWKQARKANDDIRKALNSENYAAVVQSSLELDRLLGEGIGDYAAWEQIQDLIEQRRKLLDSEAKQLTAMGQTINAMQAMTLVAALLGSIKAHVTDRHILSAIQNDFIRITNMPETVIEGER